MAKKAEEDRIKEEEENKLIAFIHKHAKPPQVTNTMQKSYIIRNDAKKLHAVHNHVSRRIRNFRNTQKLEQEAQENQWTEVLDEQVEMSEKINELNRTIALLKKALAGMSREFRDQLAKHDKREKQLKEEREQDLAVQRQESNIRAQSSLRLVSRVSNLSVSPNARKTLKQGKREEFSSHDLAELES